MGDNNPFDSNPFAVSNARLEQIYLMSLKSFKKKYFLTIFTGKLNGKSNR